jgi:putative SOS response-associated peptidase YedK
MCYHKEQRFSSKDLVKHYKIGFPEANLFKPRIEVNGFDHALSPIITNDQPHQFQLYSWGLFPSWAKDLKLQNMKLNAKAESMHEKPSFKNYINNRCLVPATGLYEWEHKGKVKEKNLIKVHGKPIFSLAGLWNECLHPITGIPFKTFTCVTLNGFVAILEDENAWMQEGKLIVNPNTIWTPLVPPQLGLFE